MGQFWVEISWVAGTVLSGNQHHEGLLSVTASSAVDKRTSPRAELGPSLLATRGPNKALVDLFHSCRRLRLHPAALLGLR
jgi:hypothetical protein